MLFTNIFTTTLVLRLRNKSFSLKYPEMKIVEVVVEKKNRKIFKLFYKLSWLNIRIWQNPRKNFSDFSTLKKKMSELLRNEKEPKKNKDQLKMDVTIFSSIFFSKIFQNVFFPIFLFIFCSIVFSRRE